MAEIALVVFLASSVVIFATAVGGAAGLYTGRPALDLAMERIHYSAAVVWLGAVLFLIWVNILGVQ